MSIKDLSLKMKLAILYSLKYGAEKAAAKFMVPYQELLRNSMDKKIIQNISNSTIKFDIIKEAISKGYGYIDIAECLDWRDFEELVVKILHEHRYQVYKHYIIKKPRREIDIVAIKANNVLSIDCKNWIVKLYSSKMNEILDKHIERSKLLKMAFKDKNVIPIIVTIYQYNVMLERGVYIIPIEGFKQFIEYEIY